MHVDAFAQFWNEFMHSVAAEFGLLNSQPLTNKTLPLFHYCGIDNLQRIAICYMLLLPLPLPSATTYQKQNA